MLREDACQDVRAIIAPFKHVTTLHWFDWDATTQPLPAVDVVAMFREIIFVEQRLGWSGRSVAPAIWVLKEI